MESIAAAAGLALAAVAAAWAYWRWVWFWRNPPRSNPPGDGVLSAADGTVVYVKAVEPGQPVVTIKQGEPARLVDLAHHDASQTKLVIGVFMSPFDVHYNRAPIAGRIDFVRHYPGRGRNVDMGPMHRRILTGRKPFYTGSTHLVWNERTVTKIDAERGGAPLSCYVVQIAARTVAGIDSYVKQGGPVERGAIFGMIRIGSQVDLVLPWTSDMKVLVREGDRVTAGETVLVEFASSPARAEASVPAKPALVRAKSTT